MKHENNVLMITCLFAFVCFGSSLYGAAEPNEQEMQLAKEKMQRLREVYKEVQQAEAELQQLIEEVERKEPLMRPTKDALKAIEGFYENDLAQDHQRFQQYLKKSKDRKDRKAAYRLYEHCKVIFSQNKSFELLNDPNQERLVKKPLIHIYRKVLPKDPLTGFDPNEPNDEKLWQNIKRIYFKQAPEEYLQQRREYYIKEKGVPEWLPDYAGNMAFADGMINTYETGILLLTPEDVRDAEKRVKNLYIKISKIYPSWNKMRHLLVGENNPDNELVIRAVREHMQISPTVRRK